MYMVLFIYLQSS